MKERTFHKFPKRFNAQHAQKVKRWWGSAWEYIDNVADVVGAFVSNAQTTRQMSL